MKSFSLLLKSLLCVVMCVGLSGCFADELPPEEIMIFIDGAADAFTPVSCPGGAPQERVTWTVMHFGAGDNDLEEAIVHDINEMELGLNNGSPNVNVLAMLDKKSEDGMFMFHLKADTLERDPELNRFSSTPMKGPEPNTGDPATLRDFGRWAIGCYPAESYILIIGGHGRGWSLASEEDGDGNDRSGTSTFTDEREDRLNPIQTPDPFELCLLAHDDPESFLAALECDDQEGEVPTPEPLDSESPTDLTRFIAPDDSTGDGVGGSEMLMDELVGAMRSIRSYTRREGDVPGFNRLAIFGADACLMGTIEVAYDLRNVSSYLVGSQQIEPPWGWPYSTILREINSRPSYYGQLCTDSCRANDGVCNDGGHGHDDATCALGSDCSDCGVRGNVGELAAYFVERFGASYDDNRGTAPETSDIYTLSAVHTRSSSPSGCELTMIGARNRMRTISSTLIELLEAEEHEALRSQIEGTLHTNRFGRSYIDLGLFLSNLRQRLIDRDMMPDYNEHGWTGDERYRELRFAIDELHGDIWFDLVAATVNGSYYEQSLSGLSVYFPENACDNRLSMNDYAQSDFARDSGWDDFLRTYHYEDLRKANGTGIIEGSANGETLRASGTSVLATRCMMKPPRNGGEMQLGVVPSTGADGDMPIVVMDIVDGGLSVVELIENRQSQTVLDVPVPLVIESYALVPDDQQWRCFMDAGDVLCIGDNTPLDAESWSCVEASGGVIECRRGPEILGHSWNNSIVLQPDIVVRSDGPIEVTVNGTTYQLEFQCMNMAVKC